METPYLTVCDVTKTYCTNLTKITDNISKIKYIIDEAIYNIEIYDYTYSKDCNGITIYLETLDLSDIYVDAFYGFKLTKLILCNVNDIHNIKADVLDLSKCDNVNNINNISINTIMLCGGIELVMANSITDLHSIMQKLTI